MSATRTRTEQRESLWRGAYLSRTIGVFALAFLTAFEYLAVATVMPDVAAALDGLSLYAVGFAAPLAVSAVGYVLAGPWIDRRGPRAPLAWGIAVFAVGLVIAGTAPTMLVFVLGRAVQGLGAGLVGVALYVVVAQAYPPALHARAFTVLTGAWVLPALVGPVAAAGVADLVGWRWVFLSVPVLAVASWLLVRRAPSHAEDTDSGTDLRRRLVWAGVAAVGVLVVSLAGQRSLPAWPALLAVALVAVLVAGPRLLPPGTWTGRRGLPSIIATRGFLGAGYAAAEAYIPLILTRARGLSLAEAGWVLTVGALTWFGGSWLAANWSRLADEAKRVRLGIALQVVGISLFALTALHLAALDVPLWLPVVGWAIAGAGIGMAFSTISVLTLAAAPEGEQGRASSALQLNDALVQSVCLALGSAFFVGFAHTDPVRGASILVVAAAVFTGLALVTAARLRD